MSRRSILSVMLACSIAGSITPLCAQSRLDSLQHLDEVVITASTLHKEVMPVQQLQGEQLQRLASHSVADALRYFRAYRSKTMAVWVA